MKSRDVGTAEAAVQDTGLPYSCKWPPPSALGRPKAAAIFSIAARDGLGFFASRRRESGLFGLSDLRQAGAERILRRPVDFRGPSSSGRSQWSEWTVPRARS